MLLPPVRYSVGMWLAYSSGLHSSTVYSHLDAGFLNKQPSSWWSETCWCTDEVSTFSRLYIKLHFLWRCRETALLIDPKNSGSSSRQWVALVVGHELAHQWFGNLVTMVTSHKPYQLFVLENTFRHVHFVSCIENNIYGKKIKKAKSQEQSVALIER